MKNEISNPYEQFTPSERAYLLLNKYPLDYVKMVVNGIIKNADKNNEIVNLEYWNEVSIEIKNIINENREFFRDYI